MIIRSFQDLPTYYYFMLSYYEITSAEYFAKYLTNEKIRELHFICIQSLDFIRLEFA